MSYTPLISVVTVSYQAELTIEKTIKSVCNQSYQNIEYVFKDGESKDDTNTIIKRYRIELENRGIETKHIIGKDTGIYNAMNQALKYCKGDYILFLNADDTLYSNTILQEIFDGKVMQDEADIIYGDTDFVDDSMHFLWKGDMSVLKDKCPFCHQSSFVKRSWMMKHLFDETLRISADYDFIFKSYMDQATFFYVEKIISQFNRGGMSGVHLVENRKEHRKVQLRYNPDEGTYLRELLYKIKLINAFMQEKFFMYIPHSFCTKIRHFSKKRKMRVLTS